MLESGRFSNMMGLSLLGFWLARINFFTDATRYAKKYLPLLMAMLLLAIRFYYATQGFMAIPHPEKADDVWLDIHDIYFDTLLTFANVLILMLLYRYETFKKVFAWFAGAGRMTLSFYVGQSLLMVPFFYPFGFNAWRWMGQGETLLLGIVLWCAQLMAAKWSVAPLSLQPIGMVLASCDVWHNEDCVLESSLVLVFAIFVCCFSKALLFTAVSNPVTIVSDMSTNFRTSSTYVSFT